MYVVTGSVSLSTCCPLHSALVVKKKISFTYSLFNEQGELGHFLEVLLVQADGFLHFYINLLSLCVLQICQASCVFGTRPRRSTC